jgi:deoxyribonuclease V
MRIQQLHDWNVTPTAAVALQRELAGKVDTLMPVTNCDLLAGADASYNRFSPIFYGVVIVLRASDWSIVEKQEVVRKVNFPYVPGLLSFREAPILLEAFARLQTIPDIVMIDGQGIAHPRRLGIASHVGLWLNLPTIGCAKSRLTGTYKEPGRKRGSMARLKDKGDVIGSIVRTRDGVKPVFVSVGHKIDQASAVRLVLQSAVGYRIPEPTRQAHLHVNMFRRRHSG